MKKTLYSAILVSCSLLLFCGCSQKDSESNKEPTTTKSGTYQLEVEDSDAYRAIAGEGMIFEVDKDTQEASLTSYYDVEQESFVVPDEILYQGKVYPVTSVGESAFESDPVLTSVTLGSNVATLKTDAFYCCPELTSLILDDKLTDIQEYGIGGCDKLAEITLPDSLKTVGDYAFTNLTSLKEIRIPAGITSWGQEVFSECSVLQNVVFADGIEAIGSGMFTNCTKLKDVTFEGTVEKIAQEAFWGCTDLTTLSLPEGLTTIEDNAFYDTSIDSLQLPDSLSKVTATSFDGMGSLKQLEVSKNKKSQYEEIADELDIKLVTG